MRTILRTSLLLLALGTTAIQASAQAFVYENLWYRVTGENECRLLERDEAAKDITELTIPATVVYEGKEYTVTALAPGSLLGSKITSVTLPETVTYIGAGAFSQTPLPEFTMPATVKETGENLFLNCMELERVTFEGEMKELAMGMFSGCVKLHEITFPEGLEKVGEYTFGATGFGEITIPEGVTFIGHSSFANCKQLSAVNFPGTLTTICTFAFGNCDALRTVTLPASLRWLEDGVFASCDGLKEILVDPANPFYDSWDGSLYSKDRKRLLQPLPFDAAEYTVPDGVEAIGDYAFYGFSSLRGMELPESVTFIGRDAFASCGALENVTFGEALTEIDTEAFFGCQRLAMPALPASLKRIGNYAFARCGAITEVTVPEGVRYLLKGAFAECTSLKSAEINGRPDYMDDELFDGCTALERVTMPPTTGSIRMSAFRGCRSLQSVTIPAKTASIAYSAFQGCTSLSDITMLPAEPPRLYAGAFDTSTCENATLRVPAGSAYAYIEAEGWSDFRRIAADTGNRLVLDDAAASIPVGGTLRIGGKVYDAAGEEITLDGETGIIFSCVSRDSEVAEIEGDATVKGVATGEADIYVEAIDPRINQVAYILASANCHVTVCTPEEVASLAGDDPEATAYDLGGNVVARGADAIRRLPAGLYIVAAGGKSRKVMVR